MSDLGESSGGAGPQTRGGAFIPEFIEDMDVGPLTSLVAFDIRNGELATVRSLLVKPTIGLSWHWAIIPGLRPELAIRHTAAFIRAAYARLVTHPLPSISPGTMKKLAIILGTTRAVTTELYRIDTGDLIPGERTDSGLEAVADQNDNVSIAIRPSAEDTLKEALRTSLSLNETEKSIVAAIHMCAVGLLPVQGYSLVMTGHHYLSDAKSQSRKAFDVIERQNWASPTVNSWWMEDVDMMRDAMWHKSTHPVSISLKRTLAFDEKMPKILVGAGAGPAASRLPAVESELRAANSYKTLLQTVMPLFMSYGGSLDFRVLIDAMDCVRAYPIMESTMDASVTLPPGIPPYVKNRSTALEYLNNVLERNRDLVAYCYGFYTALSEQNIAMSGGASTDTLKSSFSLSKLRTQSHASYVSGNQSFADYATARASARQRGEYNPPVFQLT